MTAHTQKFALSKKFDELATVNLEISHELDKIANRHLDEIIEAFGIIKTHYDEWRSEYNASKPSNERLYLTPYLRIVNGVRRNIYLVWVRICSESYLGNLNTGAPWKPREIKRNGKLHYNQQTLESKLSSYTKQCIRHIMDAEHCMVYLREQASITTSLFELSRTIKPTGLGLLLAKKNFNQLTELEQAELEIAQDQMIFLKATFDPLSLPKRLTNIVFSKD